MQLLLAMETNKLNNLEYISKHFNNIFSKLPPFRFVSLTHVCHHTQGWSTQTHYF